jgi:hypothetical protein
METQLARRTVEHYLPVLQAIYASLEVCLATTDMDRTDSLHFFYLEKEFGISKLSHVARLLENWLAGSKFEMRGLRIYKKDKNAKWSELMDFLDGKLIGYQNGAPVIQLTLSQNGRAVRDVGGKKLTHDFGSTGLKKNLIRLLVNCGDYVKISDIQKMIESKSEESVAKIILAINTAVRLKLQLPQTHKLIDSKRGSGYRINPIYNVILVD